MAISIEDFPQADRLFLDSVVEDVLADPELANVAATASPDDFKAAFAAQIDGLMADRNERNIAIFNKLCNDITVMGVRDSEPGSCALFARSEAGPFKKTVFQQMSHEVYKRCNETVVECPHGDLACPCPDGLICHYEGPDPWPCSHCKAKP